jgi:hypothetical protein
VEADVDGRGEWNGVDGLSANDKEDEDGGDSVCCSCSMVCSPILGTVSKGSELIWGWCIVCDEFELAVSLLVVGRRILDRRLDVRQRLRDEEDVGACNWVSASGLPVREEVRAVVEDQGGVIRFRTVRKREGLVVEEDDELVSRVETGSGVSGEMRLGSCILEEEWPIIRKCTWMIS